MSEEISRKSERLNFTFTPEVNARLRELAARRGKTMTKTLEDLIEGKRLFSDELEQFLDDQAQLIGRSRWSVIEDAIRVAILFWKFGELGFMLTEPVHSLVSHLCFFPKIPKKLVERAEDAEEYLDQVRQALFDAGRVTEPYRKRREQQAREALTNGGSDSQGSTAVLRQSCLHFALPA